MTQKLLGLHDHGVARSAQLASTRTAWRREPERRASDHCLSDGVWCEVGHLLSNDPHLLAVGLVCSEAKHFLAQSRS
jgi:hypothetical protein